MSKKVFIIISLTVAAALLLAACERSASQPSLATPTAQNANSIPQPTGMSLMEAWGTSTAVYVQTAVAMGLITAAPTSETPQANPAATPIGAVSTPLSSTLVPTIALSTVTPMPGTTMPVIISQFPHPAAR